MTERPCADTFSDKCCEIALKPNWQAEDFQYLAEWHIAAAIAYGRALERGDVQPPKVATVAECEAMLVKCIKRNADAE